MEAGRGVVRPHALGDERRAIYFRRRARAESLDAPGDGGLSRIAAFAAAAAVAVLLPVLVGCRPMRKTVAVLATPTAGRREPAEAPPPQRPTALPPTVVTPASPAPGVAPSPTATPLPVTTAPASIYQETPGVVYEKTMAPTASPPPRPTWTPSPGRRTPTRKPGVYYEDETPSPTRTPRG